ncbi:unnamed protein product [Mytilus edulis]|uniref:Peptidase M12B domain-containing protein n=1 Tax=Mytilus edulis TaxID=6550 RepID=A0A8S3Q6C2_MYTED|nr:unnamed protein product [Mytilus edulis]
MHTDLRSVIFVLILRIISTSLAKSLFEDIHLNEFINSRQLREDGFNEFELTSVQEVTSSHKQSLDASSIHRRRRSVDSTESYEIEMSAFGESYKMTLQHTKRNRMGGDRPDCFLIGNVHSHDGTVSASFCEELRGIMSTSNHDLHFEVLPHHIRKRGTLGSKQHTTMIARKRREDLLFSDLSQTNDIHQTEYNHERIHKRAVPSTDFTIELAVYVDADYLTYKLPASNMTRRVENMVCKYNAVQFEWSRADVLNYNITLSIKLLTFFDTNPSWYNASTALSVPLNTICTGTEAGLAYDHVHVHTGIPNPELGGLAYQSQVCNARYRCGVSADGITSYGTVVHEIGHNMGMLHDADQNCLSPDVGIMGGAGVGWSTCSCNDMNTMLQTGNHGCLWTDNIADNEVTPVSLLGLTLVPELPGQLKTADEICEQLYGSGFRYREYPNVENPSCNLYSCVDHNVGNTHGQMFKQSNSIPGLYCEDQRVVRLGTWTTCSRTCGRGMLYRRRICNNPTPKNNASCDGDEYEAQGCSLTPCVGDNTIDSNLIIQRVSETCQRLIDNNIMNGTEYIASGTIYSSLNHGVCEVLCDSAPGYTRPSFTRFGLIENGGQREWTEIPVGAYNIEMSFVWNDMKQYYTEIYDKEGNPIIHSHLPDGRIFQTGNSPVSFGGTLWHSDAFVAIMHAKGPLTEPVIVQVYSYGSNSNTGMKYIYSVPTDNTNSEQSTGVSTDMITTPFDDETEPSNDTATISLNQNRQSTDTVIDPLLTKPDIEQSTDTAADPLSTKPSLSTDYDSLTKSITAKTSISIQQSTHSTMKPISDQTVITTKLLFEGSVKSTFNPANTIHTSTLTAGLSNSLPTTRAMDNVSRDNTSTMARFDFMLILGVICCFLFGFQIIGCFVFYRRLFYSRNISGNQSRQETNKETCINNSLKHT